jgi:hypothetical protein
MAGMMRMTHELVQLMFDDLLVSTPKGFDKFYRPILELPLCMIVHVELVPSKCLRRILKRLKLISTH